jgi:cytidine deaminase
MKQEEIAFTITVYQSIDELNKEDAALLNEARNVTKNAYAPYSDFHVGAFAKLVNGKTVSGSNQENAAFPAGICAERTLLSTAASLFPNVGIDTIAISYNNLNGASDRPVSPCGICRQSLFEFQQRTKHAIRIIMGGMSGPVQVVTDAEDLLPLVFSSDDMQPS